jgi:hypothetical protein
MILEYRQISYRMSLSDFVERYFELSINLDAMYQARRTFDPFEGRIRRQRRHSKQGSSLGRSPICQTNRLFYGNRPLSTLQHWQHIEWFEENKTNKEFHKFET